jgi:hypothetical protein
VWLLKELEKCGVELLNITMGNPYFNPHVNRPYSAGGYVPEEHPLVGVSRMLNGISLLKKEVPEIKLISSALSYLGAIAPNVASAYINNNSYNDFKFIYTLTLNPSFLSEIMWYDIFMRWNYD